MTDAERDRARASLVDLAKLLPAYGGVFAAIRDALDDEARTEAQQARDRAVVRAAWGSASGEDVPDDLALGEMRVSYATTVVERHGEPIPWSGDSQASGNEPR